MKTIGTNVTSSNADAARELSPGSGQQAPGSVFAFMVQYQRVLNKEAREDHQLQRQEQAQQLQLQERAHQLQEQEQAQPAPGFLQSICNFLMGSDAGSGNVENGSTLLEKARQPQAEWNDWKVLKLR